MPGQGEGPDAQTQAMMMVRDQGAPLTMANIMRAMGMLEQPQRPDVIAPVTAQPIAPGTPKAAPQPAAAPRGNVAQQTIPVPPIPPGYGSGSVGSGAPAASGGQQDDGYSYLWSMLGLVPPLAALPYLMSRGPTPGGGAGGVPAVPGGRGGLPATVAPQEFVGEVIPRDDGPRIVGRMPDQLTGPGARAALPAPDSPAQISGPQPQARVGQDQRRAITNDPGTQSMFPQYEATTPKATVGDMSIEGLTQRTVAPQGANSAANQGAMAIRANLAQRGIDINSLPPAAIQRINDPTFLEMVAREPEKLEQFIRLLRPRTVRVPARTP